jgi:hypothetical protein
MPLFKDRMFAILNRTPIKWQRIFLSKKEFFGILRSLQSYLISLLALNQLICQNDTLLSLQTLMMHKVSVTSQLTSKTEITTHIRDSSAMSVKEWFQKCLVFCKNSDPKSIYWVAYQSLSHQVQLQHLDQQKIIKLRMSWKRYSSQLSATKKKRLLNKPPMKTLMMITKTILNLHSKILKMPTCLKAQSSRRFHLVMQQRWDRELGLKKSCLNRLQKRKKTDCWWRVDKSTRG